MNDVHFLDTECVLPYTVERGAYGSVQNLHLIKAIAQVCQRWHQWIHSSQNGPFFSLGANIQTICQETSAIGRIYRLNQALTAQGKKWFEYVESNTRTILTKIPQNDFIVKLPNNYNANGISLMHKTLDVVIANPTNLSLIDLLITHGADINEPFIHQGRHYRGEVTPLAYIWLHGGKQAPLLADYLIGRNANLKQHFGQHNDNILTYLSKGSSYQDSENSALDYEKLCLWYLHHCGDLDDCNSAQETGLLGALHGEEWWPFSDNIYYAQALIDNGADLTRQNIQGDHAIHLICRNLYGEDKLHLAKHLLGIAPNEARAQDGAGHSPLYYSLLQGDIDLAREIVSHLGKTQSNETNKKLLGAYLEFIATDAFTQFLEKSYWSNLSVDSMSKLTKKLYFPLLQCALWHSSNHPHRARKTLLIRDPAGDAFVHCLARICPWIIPILRRKNFLAKEDLKQCDKTGMTLKNLVKQTLNTFQYAIACYQADLKTITSLCGKPLNWQFRDPSGRSFLHLTLEGFLQEPGSGKLNHYLQTIELQLKSHANPNAIDHKGNTPLHYATDLPAVQGTACILTLINAGANPDQANARNVTSLSRIADADDWGLALATMRGVLTEQSE